MDRHVSAPVPGLGHTDSLELLDRQSTVLELVASGASRAEVLEAVTAALEQLIPGSRCSVLLLDAEAGTLHHGAAPTLPVAYSAAIDGLAIGDDAGSCGAAAYHDREIVAGDIALDRRWDRYRGLALPHGLRACWSSPIRGRAAGAVLGTFAVYHDRPHLPTEREQRLVERFTQLASVAIEHSRLCGALTESEERFRRAFEDNAVGMALTSFDGRFNKVNRALREMLGRSEEELLAADLAALVRPDALDAVATRLDRLTAEPRESVQFETTLLRPDGVHVLVAVTASVVHASDGAPAHLSVTMLDVTARRASERDRQARREAELARGVAEAASRAKSEFLSALSHELRTPLQAITGFTELLGTLDLCAERRAAALNHITSATSHILALVDDVLDIATIEAGALPLRLADLDLAAVVGDVLDLLEPLATERGIAVTAGAISGRVHADQRRLRQVLLNLVTNGIRHNSSGGWVRVTAMGEVEAVTVRVTDSGPGIPEELMPRLFVPFDRLGVTSEPGAGLGMTLALGLTEAMGGGLSPRTSRVSVCRCGRSGSRPPRLADTRAAPTRPD